MQLRNPKIPGIQPTYPELIFKLGKLVTVKATFTIRSSLPEIFKGVICNIMARIIKNHLNVITILPFSSFSFSSEKSVLAPLTNKASLYVLWTTIIMILRWWRKPCI